MPGSWATRRGTPARSTRSSRWQTAASCSGATDRRRRPARPSTSSVSTPRSTYDPRGPRVRVVDIHPLAPSDPNGVDIFYLMLVATIVGFITVFQLRANAQGLPLRHWTAFVTVFALVAALVLTLVAGPVLGRLPVPVATTWGLLALHVLAVASFASIMTVVLGRWAIP